MTGSSKRFLIAAAALAAPLVPSAYGQLPSGQTWQYQWGDEFAGTALDTTKWVNGQPGYINSSQSLATADTSKVTLAGGNLVLSATRNAVGSGYDKSWTSGAITTYPYVSGKGVQTPLFSQGSYFEARINLPDRAGSWPAFWGLDPNGTKPELDIMEYPLNSSGTNKASNGYANNQYHTAYHYNNYANSGAGQVTTGSNLSTTAHNFGASWIGTSLKFYLDGALVKSFDNAGVSQMDELYLILNYAVGGNPDTWIGRPSTAEWAVGTTDQTTVDWIRVWKAATAKTSDWANASTATTATWNTSSNWSNGAPNLGGVTSTFGTVAAAVQQIQLQGRRTTSVINFDGSTQYRIGLADGTDRLALAWGNGGALVPTINVAATSTVAHSIDSTLEIAGGLNVTNNSAQPLTFSGLILGDGTVTVSGPGAVVFSNNNTYGGDTFVGNSSQGPAVALVNRSRAFGTGTVTIGTGGNAATARIEIQDNRSLPNAITLPGRNNATAAIVNNAGANTLSGTISAQTGGSTYAIRSDAGTLQLTGVDGGGVALTSLAAGNRTFTLAGDGNGVVSGVVTNGNATVSIAKSGAGTWTISGANAFTGGVNVTAGTLLAGSTSALGTGAVTVGTAGTLAVAAGTDVGGLARLTVATGGTLSFLAGAELSIASGTFTLGDATIDLNNAFDAAGTYTLIDGVAGANAIGNLTFVDVSPAFQYAVSIVDGDAVLNVSSLTAVPEPVALAALAAGGSLLLGRRRRRAR